MGRSAKDKPDFNFYKLKELSRRLKAEQEEYKEKLKRESKKLKHLGIKSGVYDLNRELCTNMVWCYNQKIEDCELLLYLLKVIADKDLEDRQRGN